MGIAQRARSSQAAPLGARRKWVTLDIDHPDIEEFINWKVHEEQKVAALVSGSKMCNRHMNAILGACLEGKNLSLNGNLYQPDKNPSLTKAIRAARLAGVPDNYIHRTLQLARQGITEIEFEELDTNWEGEAYISVSGQNSNNSIRVSDDFMEATEKNSDWNLIRRTDGEIADSVSSKELWNQIGYAAWCCADPGLQFDTTINDWHTCTADGRINGSNPCSEYMFLDDTACNLASMNLIKFLDTEKKPLSDRRLSSCYSPMDSRPRNFSTDGAIPQSGNSQTLIRVSNFRTWVR